MVGRDRELAAAERALEATAARRSRTLIISGPAGTGKSSMLSALTRRARELGLRIGQGTAAPVEGAWPYAPIVEAMADLCRRHPTLLDGLADQHREEIDRVLVGEETSWSGGSSHQRLFVATAELVRLAAATNGLLLTFDDLHDADDSSLRLLHYLARADARRPRLPRPRPPTAPFERHPDQTRQSLSTAGATGRARSPRSGRCRGLGRSYVAAPTDEQVDESPPSAAGSPSRSTSSPAAPRGEPAGCSLRRHHDRGHRAGHPRRTARVAVVGSSFDTDEFVALSGLPDDDAYAHLDGALAALVVEPTGLRLPVPPQARPRRATGGRPAPSAAAHPPGRRRTAGGLGASAAASATT